MSQQRALLIRELNQWVMPIENGKTCTTSADTISSEALNALRCILTEIEEASVLIAITASIASALADARTSGVTLKHLTTYLPADPKVYRRNIDIVTEAALSPTIILPIQAYHARLSYALRLTHAVVDAGPAPSTQVGMTEIEKVEEAWKHVCGTALGAISAVRDILASVRYTRPPVVNEHAEALLRSANAGGRPCMDDKGHLRMPRWAESRSHERHVSETIARVHMDDGQRQIVVVENASLTGLGLNQVKKTLASGARIDIELEDGEFLTGKIMWVRGERAGVQLAQMLTARHKLLGGKNKPDPVIANRQQGRTTAKR